MIVLFPPASAAELTFADFVGTWIGASTSETQADGNYPLTLAIQADGRYDDSSGTMMPTTYPDTQEVRYDEATNRLIFKYLKTFYSGTISRFYQSFLFEVAEFTGEYLDLQYNPHDFAEGLPHVQRLQLVNAGSLPSGTRVLFAPAARRTQAEAGHATLAGGDPVGKFGAGTVVFHVANSYTGPTTIAAGTLEVTHADAVARSAVTVRPGGTLAVAPGLAIRAAAVNLAGGSLVADRLEVAFGDGIETLSIDAGSLTGSPRVVIGPGGRMLLPASAPIAVEVGGLSLAVEAGGGLLDLGAGSISIPPHAASPTALRTAIRAGRNGGSWNGSTGITSSLAAEGPAGSRGVGYAETADGGLVVSFAAPGDTDLDGQVTIFDLVAIADAAGSGAGLAADWNRGDFNYDGKTDVFDIGLVVAAGAYNQGSYLPTAPVTAVPEPGPWPILLAGLAGLARHRLRAGGRG